MEPIWIVAGRRTPQGRFLGALAGKSSVDLAVAAGQAALDGLAPDAVDQVIVGNILAAGAGMNVARQVSVRLGIPIERTAYSVNMMCASGMQAVLLAAQAIRAGEARVVLCGGTESMSNAPYLLDKGRAGLKLGHAALVDSILRDGLTDTFSNQHMGLTAETLAEECGVTREEQDAFALRSQQRWADAHAKGVFHDELAPMKELEADEHPRPDTSLEKLASLRPAFKPDGTVTSGNASGINDGAAMLVVCGERAGMERGWTPLAVVEGWVAVGCDPARMGLGPVHAVRALLEQRIETVERYEVIELNEAFAAQALACMRQLNLDSERVNPCGGAIAMGHPIGASGARLVVHLAHRIARGDARHALATLCVGGGMGVAVALGHPG